MNNLFSININGEELFYNHSERAGPHNILLNNICKIYDKVVTFCIRFDIETLKDVHLFHKNGIQNEVRQNLLEL